MRPRSERRGQGAKNEATSREGTKIVALAPILPKIPPLRLASLAANFALLPTPPTVSYFLASLFAVAFSSQLNCLRCKTVADDTEKEAKLVLPAKLTKCGELLDQMMEEPNAEKFLTPLDPEQEGVSVADYDRIVKQPMDLGRIKAQLDKEGYYKR